MFNFAGDNDVSFRGYAQVDITSTVIWTGRGIQNILRI